MNVSPQDVKKLREQTGAGMGDCKKALVEAGGNFEEASKILKKQGLASAAKRTDRHTSEGSVFVAQNASGISLVEIRCETDFVAMNEEFRKLGESAAQTALAGKLQAPSDAMTQQVQEAVLVLKENLNLGRVMYWEIADSEFVSSYMHNNGQIGVLVKLAIEGQKPSDEKLGELGRDLAMHAAAFQPPFLNSSQVDPKALADQEEIFTEIAVKEGIPEKAREGAIKGKMKKWLASSCFVEQGFVKDDKKSVSKILEDFSAASGCKVSLADYVVAKVGAE